MLLAEPTVMGAGVILCGDAHDLTSLHGTVTRIAGAAPPHLGDVIVALAFDVRTRGRESRSGRRSATCRISARARSGRAC
jgi:hypothetical protein